MATSCHDRPSHDTLGPYCSAQHNVFLADFVSWSDSAMFDGGSGGVVDSNDSDMNSPKSFPYVLDKQQRDSLLMMTMKCADLSNVIAPLPVADYWGARLSEECLAQGVAERKNDLTVTQPGSKQVRIATEHMPRLPRHRSCFKASFVDVSAAL